MNDIKKIIECIESAEHYIREPHGDCNGKYELKQLKKAKKLVKSFSMHHVSNNEVTVCECPLTERLYPDDWANFERCRRCGKMF